MGATAMAMLSGAQAAGSIASAYSESEALKAQGAHQKRMAGINAELAEMQADDAIKRGDKEAEGVRRNAKKMIGSQRAALAAQGIEIDDGSALEIQDETRAIATEDALQIKNNAWRTAWGF